MKKHRIAVVIGTRPEAIKMAPLYKALRESDTEFETVLISTGQHREMLAQVLSVFDIEPTIDLDLMRKNQSLSALTSRVMTRIEATLLEIRPDMLLVQGDTSTVFAASLVAFHLGIPVGHVEAGLRSHDRRNPFPEEINRRLTSVVTQLHFAPTRRAKNELIAEGISASNIAITGNTIVDAMHQLSDIFHDRRALPTDAVNSGRYRIILVTSHRRESWGSQLEEICLALKVLVKRFPDIAIVYPVHMNPNVRSTVNEILSGCERIYLTEPLDYFGFIRLMKKSHFILTDSGGIQEEAPTFNKPVLVLRNTTERPEAVQAGLARIVGTSKEAIIRHASELLTDEQALASMKGRPNPFGDGQASDRIVRCIRRWFQGDSVLLDPGEEFGAEIQSPVYMPIMSISNTEHRSSHVLSRV